MVSDVSAMFVATTIFRRTVGAKTRCCSAGVSRPKSGISSASPPATAANLSAVSRMSRSLGMKTSMSPVERCLEQVQRGADGGVDVGDLAFLLPRARPRGR